MRSDSENNNQKQTVMEIIDKIDGNNAPKRRNSNTETKEKSNVNKYVLFGLSVVVAIALLYTAIGYVKYFNKFLPGTTYCGEDLSGKNIDEVCEIFDNKINNYVLNVYNGGYIIDKFEPNEYELKLSDEAKNKFSNMMLRQLNIFWLPSELGKWQDNYDNGKEKFDYKELGIMDYNVHKLNFAIGDSVGYNLPATIQSRQASIFYNGNDFQIVPPVASNKIEPATYIQAIYSAINRMQTDFIIEESDVYIKNDITPEIESKLNKACTDAKSFFDSINMNIRLENTQQDFRKEIINAIYNIDANYNFICNEKTIDNGLQVIIDRYYDVGKEKTFHTSHGTDVKVTGGDYGSYINTKALKNSVKKAVIDKEDVDVTIDYGKRTLDGIDGIGNTYVEIDLSNQYLYMYSDGKLVLDCPVVTGLPGGRATPQGVYRLKNKAKNVTLVGPDYRTPVSYWMPFNGGIGLHDAVWQSSFGGQLYRSRGSHGCINMSMRDVAVAYDYARVNMPIVCYYHDRLDGFKAVSSRERNNLK